MRFLITSLSAPSAKGQGGGAQVYILNLAIELVRRGNSVTIVASKEKKSEDYLPNNEVIEGVHIIRGGNRYFSLPFILIYLIRNWNKVDIVLENIMTYPYYLPLFFPFATKKLRALKHSLPTGSVKKIADELGIEQQTVRNFFGANKFDKGTTVGKHIRPGPNGGYVQIKDQRIYDLALKITGS